jgi:uncharacterized protein
MSKKQEFYVRGMTCASCEVVIEKSLIKHDAIKRVSVSCTTGKIEIHARSGSSLDTKVLNNHLGHEQYKITEERAVDQGVNYRKIGGGLVLLLLLYFLVDKTGILNYSPDATLEAAGLFTVFGIGLIASVSSCGAIVGGLLTAISTEVAEGQQDLSKGQRFLPHLYFNAGRLIGFLVLGGLLGYVGSLVQLSAGFNGFLLFIIAIFMIGLGLHLLELTPSSFIKPPKWLTHRIHKLSESDHPFAPFVLGAATFFLPCGFTQSVQLFALSLQSALMGSMVMFAFALGTMPALIGIGMLTSFTTGKTLKRVAKTAGVIVFIVGISNLSNGLTLMGLHPSVLAAGGIEDAVAAEYVGDVQVVEMAITSDWVYSPDVITMKKDVPVEWQIQGSDRMGCARSFVVPAFGVNEILTSGKNIVEFTPTKEGKFTFSCSMGMIRGTLIVTN